MRAWAKTFTDYLTYWIKEKPKGLDFARNYYPYGDNSPNIWYERTHARHIKQIFSYIRDKDRPILDIGCGKGYALYCLNNLGFTNLTGLEYTAYLSHVARKNMEKLGLENTINIIKGDAAEFTDYDKYEVIYMFHPFDHNVMENVVKEIMRSLKRKPRPFTVIYFHPMVHILWDRSPVFKKTATTQVQYFNAILDVYYYEYAPDKLNPNGISFKAMLNNARTNQNYRV